MKTLWTKSLVLRGAEHSAYLSSADTGGDGSLETHVETPLQLSSQEEGVAQG